MTCTNANTFAEICAEAQAITPKERARYDEAKRVKLLEMRERTGVLYSVCVEKAKYQLTVVDFSGKTTVVTYLCEPMPFYQFAEWFAAFEA